MPKNTLDNSQSMSETQWNALKTAQIEAYYRKMGQYTTEAPKTPPTPKNKGILDEFSDYWGHLRIRTILYAKEFCRVFKNYLCFSVA